MKAMSEEQAAKVSSAQEDWKIIFQQGALIAMFPIEEWLEGFSRVDTIAPILDPTAYRDYLYSGKGELIQDVLRAALAFKRAILEAQRRVTEDPRLGLPVPGYEKAGAR